MNNENKSMCGPCGGKCCKNMPGAAVPSDLESSPLSIRDRLLELVSSGLWCFDYYEGDPRDDGYGDGNGGGLNRCYYLRVSTSAERGEVVDASWGGRCALLGPNGCALPFDDRPFQCRELVPSWPNQCAASPSAEKGAIAIEWIPYQDTIISVIRELGGDVDAQPNAFLGFFDTFFR